MTSKPAASVALCALLALVACGGSDGATEPSANDGDESAADTFTGTIEPLVGDAAPVDYVIDVPTGFTLSELGSANSPKLEDPDAEFGERTTDIRLLYLPEANTAQGLIDSFLAVNSTITVTGQADEDGFAWFTYTTPSVSREDEIAFGSAQSSLRLADGSALECRAATQHGIDEEWSDADATTVAEEMLAICRTLQPA